MGEGAIDTDNFLAERWQIILEDFEAGYPYSALIQVEEALYDAFNHCNTDNLDEHPGEFIFLWDLSNILPTLISRVWEDHDYNFFADIREIVADLAGQDSYFYMNVCLAECQYRQRIEQWDEAMACLDDAMYHHNLLCINEGRPTTEREEFHIEFMNILLGMEKLEVAYKFGSQLIEEYPPENLTHCLYVLPYSKVLWKIGKEEEAFELGLEMTDFLYEHFEKEYQKARGIPEDFDPRTAENQDLVQRFSALIDQRIPHHEYWELYLNTIYDILLPLGEKLNKGLYTLTVFQDYMKFAENKYKNSETDLCWLLFRLGRLAASLGQNELCKKYYERYLHLQSEKEDLDELFQIHRQLCILFYLNPESSNLTKSIDHGKKALEYLNLIDTDDYDDPELQIKLFMAYAYSSAGQVVESEYFLKETLELLSKCKNQSQWEFSVNYFAGLFYLYSSRFEEALDYLETCYQTQKAIEGVDPNNYLLPKAYWAICQFNIGNTAEAEKTFSEVIQKLPQNASQITDVYHTMARACELSGRLEKSIFYYKTAIEAIDIEEDKPMVSMEDLLVSLSEVAAKIGDNRLSVSSLEKALTNIIKESGKNSHLFAWVCNKIARVFIELGELDKAQIFIDECETYYKRLLDQRKGRNYVSFLITKIKFTYFHLGPGLHLDLIDRELIRFAEAFPEPIDLIKIETPFWIGDAYFYLQDHKSALEYYSEGLEDELFFIQKTFPFLSEEEKILYTKGFKTQFQDMCHIFLSFTGRHETAPWLLDIWLRINGLVQYSSQGIREKITESLDENERKLFEEWKRLKKSKLNFYYEGTIQRPQSQNLDVQIEQLEKLLNWEIGWVPPFEEINYEDISNCLEEGELALECIYLPPRSTQQSPKYLVLIISPSYEGCLSFVLEEAQLIDELIRKVNFQHQSKVEAELNSQSLWQLIWHPLLSILKGSKKIFLSLDGQLSLFNFNTLLNSQNGKYLIEEHELIYVDSLRSIVSRRKKITSSKLKNCLILGDPDFGKAQFTDLNTLPGSRQEALDIFQVLRKWGLSTELYLGADARKETILESGSPDIIHIATHGIFVRPESKPMAQIEAIKINNISSQSRHSWLNIEEADNPLLNSGLALAGANESLKNWLMAYEVANLALPNTQMVVLSTCESGLGKVENGEGVYGLQRAFRVAGVNTLVFSTHAVSDMATQQLFSVFYQLLSQGSSKQTALKMAQLAVKQNFPNPKDWGGFIMIES
ncbi:MAG: CHAT domain-containing protein [Bacteroidia bacterium]|nr:CHAT domain-containing protein [Bacteroidia bacterium]